MEPSSHNWDKPYKVLRYKYQYSKTLNTFLVFLSFSPNPHLVGKKWYKIQQKALSLCTFVILSLENGVQKIASVP